MLHAQSILTVILVSVLIRLTYMMIRYIVYARRKNTRNGLTRKLINSP